MHAFRNTIRHLSNVWQSYRSFYISFNRLFLFGLIIFTFQSKYQFDAKMSHKNDVKRK